MKKAIIVPYFIGEFPEYFQLFLDCWGNNLGYQLLLFTDNEIDYEYPSNVKKIKMSFEEMIRLVQGKFDFTVTLDRPYKLCDYKPAYGYIFEEYLIGYDYWGYCDIDMLFGNIENFISDDLLTQYDRLLIRGHFSVQKNTKELNSIFMNMLNGEYLYKRVFTTEKCCHFDEDWNQLPNINTLFLEAQKQVYLNENNKLCIAEISMLALDFRIVLRNYNEKKNKLLKFKKSVFTYENGHLYRKFVKNGEMFIEEYLYIHFLCRKMRVLDNVDSSKFLIIPNCFMPYPKTESELRVGQTNVSFAMRIKYIYRDFRYNRLRKTKIIKM